MKYLDTLFPKRNRKELFDLLLKRRYRRMRFLGHCIMSVCLIVLSISLDTFGYEKNAYQRVEGETVLSQIERAYRAGEIDRETALLNKAYALFEPTRLSPQFQQEIHKPTKCGTPVVLEILEAWEDLSASAQKILSVYFERPPTQHTFNSPSGRFKIHYDSSGLHAVYEAFRDSKPTDGVPDYVNRCAEIFDHVWAVEVDSMGYDAPPSDGTKGGEEDKYDVYLQHESMVYGVCYPEDPSSQYPDRTTWTSYIHVDPTYEGFGYDDPLDPLSVTAAHEFFHAIQYAYNLGAGSWYMEISSVWMEDILYDEVNDYLDYLGSFYTMPEVSLDTTEPSLHQYGSCVWDIYLSENYGDDIVRLIWEECITSSPLSAFETVLNLYGTDRDETFREFTVWNYLTGPRANGTHSHYEEAADFPLVHEARSFSTYPLFDEVVAHDDLPDHLASNYVRFSNDGSSGDLKIFFEGEDRYDWRASVVVSSGDAFTSFEMDLDGESGFLQIPHWEEKQGAVLIPCVVSTFGSSGSYTFSAVVSASDRPDFVFEDADFDDVGGGDGDGYFDPGETVWLVVTLSNFGIPATNIQAALETDDSEITIEKADAFFGDIGENGAGDNSADPFNLSVSGTAELHKADCILTMISNGGTDTTQTSLQLIIGHPEILLVDDDYEPIPRAKSFDVERYYRSTLDGLDEIYDYWSLESSGAPEATLLMDYRTVIWFTGYAEPVLTIQNQNDLATFLENGGHLFITGQDIASDLQYSDFLTDYLHAELIRDDSHDNVIYGVQNDPISGDIFFFSTLGDPGANNQVSPDVIAPLDGASAVFTYGPPLYEKAAIKYDSGLYRIVFFSFGFEGIVNLLGDTETLRSQILNDVLSWLNFTAQKADVNGDGEVDLLDLIRTVNIILGEEPDPTEYELWASDCNGDGEIDLFDLVGMANVILGTGTCEP